MPGVTKKTTGITSLLAARPTALRRAPKPQSPSHLRISNSDSMDLRDEIPGSVVQSSSSESPSQESLDGSVRKVDIALAAIQAILHDFVDRARRHGAGRRSPRVVAELQSLADDTVREVDRVVSSVVIDGRRVLCRKNVGDGPFLLEGPGAKLALTPMSSDDLGPAPGRSLASLQSGGQASLLITSVDQAVEIAQHSISQISVQRLQLANFTRRESISDDAAQRIAEENQRASQNALGQSDFVEIAGNLSRGNILAASLSARNAPSNRPTPPRLTISRESPE